MENVRFVNVYADSLDQQWEHQKPNPYWCRGKFESQCPVHQGWEVLVDQIEKIRKASTQHYITEANSNPAMQGTHWLQDNLMIKVVTCSLLHRLSCCRAAKVNPPKVMQIASLCRAENPAAGQHHYVLSQKKPPAVQDHWAVEQP